MFPPAFQLSADSFCMVCVITEIVGFKIVLKFILLNALSFHSQNTVEPLEYRHLRGKTEGIYYGGHHIIEVEIM